MDIARYCRETLCGDTLSGVRRRQDNADRTKAFALVEEDISPSALRVRSRVHLLLRPPGLAKHSRRYILG